MRRVLVLTLALGCGSPSGPAPTHPTGGGGGSAVTTGAPDASAEPPGPPKPLDEDYPRLADGYITMYETIGTGFAVAGSDCGAATGTLTQAEQANAEILAAVATVRASDRRHNFSVALGDDAQRYALAVSAVIHAPVVTTCKSDPAFTAAFDALQK